MDPFILINTRQGSNDSTQYQLPPPVEAADLISYLVLQTSFVTAMQFKAHKSIINS